MKVWITKYALTTGIHSCEALDEHERGMVTVPGDHKQGTYTQFFHTPDWHRTEADAITRAEAMRVKKIASVEKQLAKLRELKFKA